MKFDTRNKVIFFLCCVLLYYGCTPSVTKEYQGKLPSDKIATIETSKGLLTSTKISKVDGKRVRTDVPKIEVLPGEHQLTCHVEHKTHYGFGWIVDEGKPQTFNIQAEAGHSYKVYGKWNSIDDTQIWIEDKQTDAIVAGKRPE